MPWRQSPVAEPQIRYNHLAPSWVKEMRTSRVSRHLRYGATVLEVPLQACDGLHLRGAGGATVLALEQQLRAMHIKSPLPPAHLNPRRVHAGIRRYAQLQGLGDIQKGHTLLHAIRQLAAFTQGAVVLEQPLGTTAFVQLATQGNAVVRTNMRQPLLRDFAKMLPGGRRTNGQGSMGRAMQHLAQLSGVGFEKRFAGLGAPPVRRKVKDQARPGLQ